MNTLRLNVDELMKNHTFVCAEPAQLGAWLMLVIYCALNKTGGRIANCRDLSDVAFGHSLKTDREVIDSGGHLWSWDGDDLIVNLYPIEQDIEKQKMSAGGRKGAARRWGSAAATNKRRHSSTTSTIEGGSR